MKLSVAAKSLFIFFAVASCYSSSNDDFPLFKPNTGIANVWTPIRQIAEYSDFSVAITTSSWFTNKYDVHKMITVRNKDYQVIEFKFNLLEPDTSRILSRTEEYISKDVVIKKYISKEHAFDYIKAFEQLGLFEMEDEQDLIDQCQHERGRKEKISYDGTDITFYITRKNKVRRLSYYDPWRRRELCPETKQWQQILKIDSIFRREWFLDKHY